MNARLLILSAVAATALGAPMAFAQDAPMLPPPGCVLPQPSYFYFIGGQLPPYGKTTDTATSACINSPAAAVQEGRQVAVETPAPAPAPVAKHVRRRRHHVTQ